VSPDLLLNLQDLYMQGCKLAETEAGYQVPVMRMRLMGLVFLKRLGNSLMFLLH
jgi:hypothetical protein